MINSQGHNIEELTAAQAEHIYKTNPWNDEEILKADIMTGINTAAKCGQISYTKFMGWSGKQISQPILDWLVGLGYCVAHSGPMGHVGHIEYAYTIYWAYLPDAPESFVPGEKFPKNNP